MHPTPWIAVMGRDAGERSFKRSCNPIWFPLYCSADSLPTGRQSFPGNSALDKMSLDTTLPIPFSLFGSIRDSLQFHEHGGTFAILTTVLVFGVTYVLQGTHVGIPNHSHYFKNEASKALPLLNQDTRYSRFTQGYVYTIYNYNPLANHDHYLLGRTYPTKGQINAERTPFSGRMDER